MRNNIKRLVIHCSATREGQDYTFEQLEKDHKLRGFSECGYNYYIRKDGTVHEGRYIGQTLAHATGFNLNSIAVCYEGGLSVRGKSKDTRTPQQEQVLLNIILFCKTIWPNIEVLGHRDLSEKINKDCPCFDAKSEYNA